jgi:hypothetical protein
MSNDSPDLSKRRRGRAPQPPADYGVDSAEVAAPQGRKPEPAEEEPVVQLNTRVAWSYKKRLDRLKNDNGTSIRDLIETAIDRAYPNS